jgi:hypothetical protein
VERVHHGPRHLPRQDREHVPGAEGELQPRRPATRGQDEQEEDPEARERAAAAPPRGHRRRPDGDGETRAAAAASRRFGKKKVGRVTSPGEEACAVGEGAVDAEWSRWSPTASRGFLGI